MTTVTLHNNQAKSTRATLRNRFFAFFVIAIIGIIAVETRFADARFPVPLKEGQMAFDADLIRGYYATLKAQGTFGIYVQTQLIDFMWIIGLGATGYFLHQWLKGSFRPKSLLHRYHSIATYLLPFAATMDALENVTSFFMLASPVNFPSWLAPIYSSFATVKWTVAPIGVSAAVLGVVLTVIALAYNWIAASMKNRAQQR